MISDTIASKITQKHLFYKAFTVRDVEVVGSNPVTSTIKARREELIFSLFSFVIEAHRFELISDKIVKTSCQLTKWSLAKYNIKTASIAEITNISDKN